MNKTNHNSYELILKQTSNKKSSIFSFRKTYPAYIILAILLIASVVIRFFVANNIEKNLNNDFEKANTSIMNRLSSHYSKQVEVLYSMVGLYDNLIEVVKDYFELYATIPTKNYPSILSVSYVPQVLHKDLYKFIKNAQNLGYFDYQLKMDTTYPFYFPFVNMVPEVTNFHRFGLDLARNKFALESILRARETNVMTATEVHIVRPPDTLGLYLFMPIYKREMPHKTIDERKENFQGSLCLELDVNRYVTESLNGKKGEKSTSAPADTTLIYEILEKKSDGSEQIFYKSLNHNLLGNYDPFIVKNSILNIGDKEFVVRFYTIPNYGGKFQLLLPNITFIVSVILSFAFFGFVLTQITNKAKAQEIADKMTRSQRRIVDTSNDIIAVLDESLTWKSMNPASLPILGILPEELTGKHFSHNLINVSFMNELQKMYSQSLEDHVERIDIQMKRENGDFVWVDWSFTFSISDKLIYCIGRDVTLEKKAEDDAKLRTKQIQAAEILATEANFSKTYFMKEMSHQLRNSLTGILGYLELLQTKVYDNEEELDMYVDMAASSSEELFTYVTDIDEAAKLDEENASKLSVQNISLGNIVKEATSKINNSEKFIYNISEETLQSHIIGDEDAVRSVINDSLSLLSIQADKIVYDINAEINPYEGAVEFQILSSPNSNVVELIEIYKKNSANLKDVLQFDKEDGLIKLLKIDSTMRLLRGSFKIEFLGEADGNLISLMFKSTKKSN